LMEIKLKRMKYIETGREMEREIDEDKKGV
jgi:hypothetical protein